MFLLEVISHNYNNKFYVQIIKLRSKFDKK